LSLVLRLPYWSANMGISLCMIVRNEEDWVEGAVQSVRSIVNEVIIVDTGPTDATLELDAAQKFLEAALGQHRTLTEKESGAGLCAERRSGASRAIRSEERRV